MNSICESTANMYAGKIVTRNDISYIKHSCIDNLSDKQTHTLRALKNNTDLVIKPADKGGAVVVMRADLYKQEALRQLENTNNYRPLPLGPLYIDTAQMIYDVLFQLFSRVY